LFGIKWIFYYPSLKLQLSEFLWMFSSSVWVVFNNFLILDTADRSKISNNPYWIFSRTLPLNLKNASCCFGWIRHKREQAILRFLAFSFNNFCSLKGLFIKKEWYIQISIFKSFLLINDLQISHFNMHCES